MVGHASRVHGHAGHAMRERPAARRMLAMMMAFTGNAYRRLKAHFVSPPISSPRLPSPAMPDGRDGFRHQHLRVHLYDTRPAQRPQFHGALA